MTDRQRNIVMNAVKMGGVFISCGNEEKNNIMNTSWGMIGRIWNRDVFILPVRKKKYTHDIIQDTMSFVVNVPTPDMTDELAHCANVSGRNLNKFEEFNFHAIPAKKVNSIGIKECNMRLECKVVYVANMHDFRLNPTILRDMYVNKELHTLYFGEIVGIYEK